MTATLVIGIGNPERGDDAVGLEVARRLRARSRSGTTVCESSGEASDLMEAFREADTVMVVDAAVGGKPGSWRRLDAVREALPAGLLLPSTSTHSWGLAEAVALARAMGELPRRLVIYAVFGRCFATGERRLSPEVEMAVERVVDTMLAEQETSILSGARREVVAG